MYTLPKIWQGRISKYWDKFMPSDYPASSSTFSQTFDNEEQINAVTELENQLGTDESVVPDLVPEGTYPTNYIGTYNVEGTPGERTLLSPERVDTDNVVALHYAETDNNGYEWVVIPNTEVVDGYVWGTLESFSPIAIFEYKKDIHQETSIEGIKGISSFVVCEGNTVKVIEDESGTYVLCMDSGTRIDLTTKSYIIGGSIDGSPIKSTNITLLGLTKATLVNKVIGGSFYIGEGFTTVDSVNVYGDAKIIGCLTGSWGAIRTNKVIYNLKNAYLSWIGCGESYANINTSTPDLSSRAWVKEVHYNFENVSSNLCFLGQNCEYYYVDNTEGNIVGGRFDYLINGGSNAQTKDSVINIKDASIGIFQTTNRGHVANAKAVFTGCTVENLFVGGDPTDSTVTGTTGTLRYEINKAAADEYHIKNGTEAGHLLTAVDVEHIVDSIKVSRSANVTVDNDIRALLGDKYIEK